MDCRNGSQLLRSYSVLPKWLMGTVSILCIYTAPLAAADRSSANFMELGTWPSDPEHDHESRGTLVDTSRTNVEEQNLSNGLPRRSLLFDMRDISPPGLWPIGDDDDFGDGFPTRSLLSDFRDISPPGMWPVGGDDDDDEDEETNFRSMRALLSEFPLLGRSGKDDQEHVRRALLPFAEKDTDSLRHRTPPGMWFPQHDTSSSPPFLFEVQDEIPTPVLAVENLSRRGHSQDHGPSQAHLRGISNSPMFFPIAGRRDELHYQIMNPWQNEFGSKRA